MTDTLIIGIGYKARQGKDTAAQGMLEARPDAVRIYSLAYAVKMLCRLAGEMTLKDSALLQEVATKGRETREDTWIEALSWQIDEEAPRVAVITDVRYQNEVDWIQAQGGKLIKVSRIDRETGQQVFADDRPLDHPSETELDTFSGWDLHLREIYPQKLKRLAGEYVERLLHV